MGRVAARFVLTRAGVCERARTGEVAISSGAMRAPTFPFPNVRVAAGGSLP
jgi:hypothetical protein